MIVLMLILLNIIPLLLLLVVVVVVFFLLLLLLCTRVSTSWDDGQHDYNFRPRSTDNLPTDALRPEQR